MMASPLNKALCVSAFAVLAVPAHAAPISINFGDTTTISNTNDVGIDVFGAPSVNAAGLATLGGPDGQNDIFFTDGNVAVDSDVIESFGSISGFGGLPNLGLIGGGSEISTSVSFAHIGGNLRRFNDGDEISGAVLGSSWRPFGTLYSGGTGVLDSVGSSGIFGFRVDVNELTPGQPIPDDVFQQECIDVEPQPPFCNGGLGQIELVDSFYGWLEIERGSIILKGGAFNTTGGGQGILAGTTTATNSSFSAVPLPAAGWMLLAGLGGMAAMGRRRKG